MFRIGARASALSQAQTRQMAAVWQAHTGEAPELVWLTTTGDVRLDGPLVDIGGKGLFTKELDEALLRGEIDAAVHSMKDLPVHLPEGIALAAVLPREDPRDAFLSTHAQRLEDLSAGSVVGTASIRRTAQVKRVRPDLDVRLLRGNVDTRLRKLNAGQFDAILLATAGLNRLGLAQHITAYLSVDQFVPAPAQGAVAVTTRAGEEGRVAHLICAETTLCVRAERAALATLDGSCRTAIGAHARLGEYGIELTVEWLSDDGQRSVRECAACDPELELAMALGQSLGARVKAAQ